MTTIGDLKEFFKGFYSLLQVIIDIIKDIFGTNDNEAPTEKA